MAKNKHMTKKNTYERTAYNSFIADNSVTYGETMTINMDSLMGTKEGPKDSNIVIEKAPIAKPLRYAIFDWVKENLILAIAVPVLVAAFSWLLGNTISLKIDTARLDERIIMVKESIKDLNISYSAKDKLLDEILSIKADINSMRGDSDRLEKRIKYVEDEIDRLKK